jgi:Fic family protein
MPTRSYIWQDPAWPALRFDAATLSEPLGAARREQGAVMALFRSIGMPSEGEIEREIWSGEALATAAIEGEKLDLQAVRSSVVRRLGIEGVPKGRASRHVDGLVEVMHDATHAFEKPLDDNRLARWQAALFPAGTSGIRKIVVGRYRKHDDPMQIVSGPVGRERVHYEAPASKQVPAQMRLFLAWWEGTRPDRPSSARMDGIVRAAIAHLWFETIHPFEDGNGRVGRAVVDMALAQDARNPHRFYSLSRQLMDARDAYYGALNAAQLGTLDATPWIAFFVEQFRRSCLTSLQVIEGAIEKNRFWATHARTPLNERQRKAVQRLLDAGPGGFEGGMTAEKYARLTGASKATATRDLRQLEESGVLAETGQGRGTRYWLALQGWQRGR